MITNSEELGRLRGIVAVTMRNAVTAIGDIVAFKTPIEVLVRMKFHELGFHPIENRRLNLIEQVNQTFTYLVSFAAAGADPRPSSRSGPNLPQPRDLRRE
jgi:hypothetical protein